MKPEELRIGNYIIANNELIKVESISSEAGGMINIVHGELSGDIKEVIYLEDVKPIPLTEEWLFKFGFKEKKAAGCENEYILINDAFELSWDSETGLTLFLINSLDSVNINHLKYAHQLQNFVYSTFNEELQLKELAK